MTDHPSTFKAAQTPGTGIDWDDHASLHRKDDGQGVLSGLKGLRSGTLAELVGFVMKFPEAERSDYVIQKAGDHRMDIAEIAGLAARDDFRGLNRRG